MKLGYIRVSRDKQTTALQEDAMRQEQCARTFTDKMTGKRFDRPEFLRLLDVARTGDVIVVWRLSQRPDRDNADSGTTWDRIEEPQRKHRHHNTHRQIDVPSHGGSGRVRARRDP